MPEPEPNVLYATPLPDDSWIIAPVASGNEFENYLRKNLMGTSRRDGEEAEGAARWGQTPSAVGTGLKDDKE